MHLHKAAIGFKTIKKYKNCAIFSFHVVKLGSETHKHIHINVNIYLIYVLTFISM